MAEILIKARDATHADPEKDRRGCYKRGMPVVVMPDGHVWGAAEVPPAFVVLRLPGISEERVRQFLAPDEVDDPASEVGSRLIYRRRMWRVLVENLPAAARTRWLAQGSLTIGPDGDYTWSQFRAFLRNLRDGSFAPADL